MKILIISTCLLLYVTVAAERECQNEVPYHLHLGTKSAYRFLANLNDTRINLPGCKEQKLWMIIRHGTRYPGTKKIKKMDDVLTKLRNEILTHYEKGTLCKQEKELFRKWKIYPRLADHKNLAHEGEDEMIELAERMQNRFPELLPSKYDNKTYYFRYTATQRCAESARHFAIGLFGRKISRYVWYPDPSPKDPVLRFYKLCEKWKAHIKKNDETYFESDQFGESYHVRQVQEDVTERLGLPRLIPTDSLRVMYSACGFETAWSFRHTSPWCLAFSQDNFKVMEYWEDLRYYWVDGHGHNLTKSQACPVVKDLFDFFENGDDDHKSVIYFAHSGTVLKILSHLELYQDPYVLQHDNFDEAEARQWRVSKIDSFATNIAFVLYECEDDKKIMLLHQEREIFIRGCPENELCPLETFKEIFIESILRCNFDEMCSLPLDRQEL